MKKNNVYVIKANYRLQTKVGMGPIDPHAVAASQHIIETNQVDFTPLAITILDTLNAALEQTKNPAVTMNALKALLTKPVMELKANAAIFHYDLVGSLASVMLGFLENIKIMDSDAIDIVRAHHASLHMIVVRKISGDGGVSGAALVRELQLACDRYYHKKFVS